MTKSTDTTAVLLVLIATLKPKHFWCDGDNWYSCPKAPNGCADDSQGSECNCGADERTAEIAKILTELGFDADKIL